MLQQLFHIILVSFICCLWGIPILLVMEKKGSLPQPWHRSATGFFAFLFFSGCITLCAIASWLYLFLPLKFYYLAGLTLLLIFILVAFCRERIYGMLSIYGSFHTPDTADAGTGQPFIPGRKIPRALIYFGLVCGLMLLLFSSLKTVNKDTLTYHLQIIRWAHEYRVVPGLANIFPRLGHISTWFCLTSFFYIPWFRNENFTYLNATAMIWFFLWICSNWKYHFCRMSTSPISRFLGLFYFLLLLYNILDWEMLRDTANSASYDMSVTVFTLLAICFLLENIFEPAYRTGFSVIFFIILISTITFKLTGVLSLLLILYHMLSSRPSVRQLILCALAAFIILSPLLIKNYIATGYPLYPLAFSFGSPDWQLPRDMLENFNSFILLTTVGQWTGIPADHSFLTDLNWFPEWAMMITRPQKVLMLLTLSSLPLLFIRTRLGTAQRPLRFFLAVLLLSVAAWFFIQPSPRFGLSFLLGAGLLPVSLILYKKIRTGWYGFFFLVIAAGCILYMSGKTAILFRTPVYLLHPVNAIQAPCQVKIIRGIPFHLAENIPGTRVVMCFNTELPVICQENPYLQPRGSTLQDGFRMSTPDSAFIKHYKY